MIWLAAQVSDIDERFNESRWLDMSIYNIAVVVAILILLTLALPDMKPRLWMVMLTTVIFYLTLSSFALIFFPKFFRIWIAEHEYEDLYGSSVADEVEDAEELLEKEKNVEKKEKTEQKKGLADMTNDEKMSKLKTKREKRVKDLQKLLKIVERAKQRMKLDMTNLGRLSSEVLALQHEIDYRRKLEGKGGSVNNQSSAALATTEHADVELQENPKTGGDTEPVASGGGAASDDAGAGGGDDDYGSEDHNRL